MFALIIFISVLGTFVGLDIWLWVRLVECISLHNKYKSGELNSVEVEHLMRKFHEDVFSTKGQVIALIFICFFYL